MPPFKKPTATLADYLVIGISPVLIMLLVGSLAFFLIEVFFHGAAIGSVRWVMFWFVMAVVLVSRIGIEQGTGHAAVYGLGLAAATWLYLVRIHPAFILGMILLGLIWWCAHKLTWDCTLMNESEDASGDGLLQTAGDKKNVLALPKSAVKIRQPNKKIAAPHPPGLWVVYFSLAALPLFGLGQMLLPKENLAARHAGFIFLFVYVAAALGLLLTTSFLGLRRYLRQRFLSMPPLVAFGWIRFGVGIAAFVLIGALLLPRPGANAAWQALHYQVDHRLRQASDYAARFGPHGKGEGRSGNEAQNSNSNPSKNPDANVQPQSGSGQTPNPGPNGENQNQGEPSSKPSSNLAGQFYRLFKILFFLALALFVGWWIFRRRDLTFQIVRSVLTALQQFFRNLFGMTFSAGKPVAHAKKPTVRQQLFSAYKNPFLTGKDTAWTQEKIIIYSYEALLAWAEEQGLKARPEQTAREFCAGLGDRFLEINSDVNYLSFLYGRAAYGLPVSANADLEPLKNLWRFLSA